MSCLRRSLTRFAKTNRYTDGSGRTLESNELPKDLYLPPMSNRAYPRQTEPWQPTMSIPQSSRKVMALNSGNDHSDSTSLFLHEQKSSLLAGKLKKEEALQKISPMETVMITRPTPHKGTVIISGGGVLGLTTAALWSLKGWHTTVLERGQPVSSALPSAIDSPSLTSSTGRLRRPHLPEKADEEEYIGSGKEKNSPNRHHNLPLNGPYQFPHFLELQYALINRRAADVFEQAGIPISVLRECGVSVTGIMEHPGAYHSWISRGLTELNRFAAKLLAVDIWALREKLEEHVFEDLKTDNACVFYEHEIDVVYPLRHEVVIKHREKQEGPIDGTLTANRLPHSERGVERQEGFSLHHTSIERIPLASNSSTEKASLSFVEDSQKRKKLITSLSISPMRWEKKYTKDAVHYDLLLSAEGVNSSLRELLDVEGFSADEHFSIKWFLLRVHRRNQRWEGSSVSGSREVKDLVGESPQGTAKNEVLYPSLSPSYIHRWLHACPPSSSSVGQGISTSPSVPLVIAFPRIENKHASEEERFYYFSVMAYMPQKVLEEMSDEDIFRTYLPDVWKNEKEYEEQLVLLAHETLPSLGAFYTPSPSFVSFQRTPTPAPTVFCEHLFNTAGLPNAVVLGDAAHFCNPFWLQQLPMALEDSLYLLQHVDSSSRHVYDAIKQFSDERGVCGDALREITEKCLYYETRKHRNPFLRLRNSYHRWMYHVMPEKVNTMYEGSTNHLYSRSIEEMLNGRGYASYEFVEKQQSKHRMFYHLGRLYT